MKLASNQTVAVAAAAAFGCSALAAPAIAARSHKVNAKVTKPIAQVDDVIGAIYGGTPFGTCKMQGKLVIPKTIQVWNCGKKGKFTLTGASNTGASDNAKGTWTIKKGSGTKTFKGMTGKGTFAGKISTGRFTYRGTVKY